MLLEKTYFRARKNNGVLFEPDANTVLWLPGQDDPQSSTIRDRSGNGNDGTITTATWARNSQGIWSLNFNGASGYVTVTDATAIQNIFDSGGTIECWVNVDSDGEGNQGHIFNKRTSAKGWSLRTSSEANSKVKLAFQQIFSGDNPTWTTSSTEVTINTWTHIVVTYNNSALGNDPILYVNSSSVTLSENQPPTGVRSSDVAEDLYLGNNNGDSRTLDGDIALSRFNNSILTATQVAGNYNQERHLFGV